MSLCLRRVVVTCGDGADGVPRKINNKSGDGCDESTRLVVCASIHCVTSQMGARSPNSVSLPHEQSALRKRIYRGGDVSVLGEMIGNTTTINL